mmetsp:Transcript_85576/g.238917  ORF Transcript_85576/g.238917 Transcript_85576/m.238917 type:complete len:363 (+) Transcript_85576:30-1118(+)
MNASKPSHVARSLARKRCGSLSSYLTLVGHSNDPCLLAHFSLQLLCELISFFPLPRSGKASVVQTRAQDGVQTGWPEAMHESNKSCKPQGQLDACDCLEAPLRGDKARHNHNRRECHEVDAVHAGDSYVKQSNVRRLLARIRFSHADQVGHEECDVHNQQRRSRVGIVQVERGAGVVDKCAVELARKGNERDCGEAAKDQRSLDDFISGGEQRPASSQEETVEDEEALGCCRTNHAKNLEPRHAPAIPREGDAVQRYGKTRCTRQDDTHDEHKEQRARAVDAGPGGPFRSQDVRSSRQHEERQREDELQRQRSPLIHAELALVPEARVGGVDRKVHRRHRADVTSNEDEIPEPWPEVLEEIN